MNLLLALLPVVGLATWQAVETLHHGSIFARARAYCEVRGGFFCELFLCPFCLSHWMALVMSLFAFQFVFQRELTISEWSLVPVYTLAVTRLANVLNDVTHEWCRTPGRVKIDENDLADLAGLNKTEDANATESNSPSSGGERGGTG